MGKQNCGIYEYSVVVETPTKLTDQDADNLCCRPLAAAMNCPKLRLTANGVSFSPVTDYTQYGGGVAPAQNFFGCMQK